VRSGLWHILFAKRPESEAAAIDAYLRSLRPMPSPQLRKGALAASALRGKVLFESARTGCSACHPPGLFSDLRSYDVGTRGRSDREGDRFDTPTLVELWRAAPYLHDGRAKTLEEIWTVYQKDDLHGVSSYWSKEQLNDLVEYLKTL